MAKLVLVTRPLEQANSLADTIRVIGYLPLIQPLLEIKHFPCSLNKIQKPDAILLSSVQAVQGMIIPNNFKNIPVFCVGQMTEKSAQQAGFQNTYAGTDNLNGILPFINEHLTAGQSILYLRGEEVSQDIKAVFPSLNVDEVVTYTASPVSDFSAEVMSKFAEIDVITVFSARSGTVLEQLIEKNGLIPYLKNINLLCLSSSVVESLGEMNWKACHVADMPNQNSLIEKLKSI